MSSHMIGAIQFREVSGNWPGVGWDTEMFARPGVYGYGVQADAVRGKTGRIYACAAFATDNARLLHILAVRAIQGTTVICYDRNGNARGPYIINLIEPGGNGHLGEEDGVRDCEGLNYSAHWTFTITHAGGSVGA